MGHRTELGGLAELRGQRSEFERPRWLNFQDRVPEMRELHRKGILER